MAILRSAAFFAAIICAAFVRSDEPKPIEIPLKDIWAYQMPGTKDVHELEPDSTGGRGKTAMERYQLQKGSMVLKIQASLNKYIPAESTKPHAGFAVAGEGAKALKEAYEVIINDKLPAHSFSDGEDVSIVFTSTAAGAYCELDSVEKKENQIAIRYRFKPHDTREYTSHFAIIPLGKLTTGKYEVNIEEVPDSHQTEPMKARHIVCDSFSFEITKGQP